MVAIGGSIESISLSGRIFSVPADADTGRKLGGFENEFQANGDGTGRLVKTRMGWSIDGLLVQIDDTSDDDDFLRDLANEPDFFAVAITYVSGAIRQGSGQIVGENPTASQAATKAISLMGPGELTLQ